MTGAQATASPLEVPWRMVRRTVVVRSIPRSLRLVRFATGWIASADTESGPTMAVDALEPLGGGMVEAMTLVGTVR